MIHLSQFNSPLQSPPPCDLVFISQTHSASGSFFYSATTCSRSLFPFLSIHPSILLHHHSSFLTLALSLLLCPFVTPQPHPHPPPALPLLIFIAYMALSNRCFFTPRSSHRILKRLRRPVIKNSCQGPGTSCVQA